VWTASRDIQELLLRKEAWIRQRLTKEAERLRPRPALRTGSKVMFLGEELEVVLVEGGNDCVEVRDGCLQVRARAPEDAEVAVARWCARQATSLLPEFVSEWAGRTGLWPKTVAIRRQKRQWGSCAPAGTIRLNWRLVMAPRQVIDYVVVHELAHLKHRNHRPVFWAEVAMWMPEHKVYRKRLKELALLLEGGPVLPE
jgi:predicted metal-dependent hydrolase